MGERQKVRLGSLGEMFDGPHATPVRRADGPYFLNIASLKSGRLVLSESDHVSSDDFTKWTRRVTPRAQDLLFSYETRLGEAALMPHGVRACLGRRMALLRPNQKVIDPRFLLYMYLGPEFQQTIAKNTIHGATVPRISLSTMPDWEVEIPARQEQFAIAEVLSALDDKILSCNRIIAATEALMIAVAGTASTSAIVADLAAFAPRSQAPEDFDDSVAHFSLPAFDERAMPELVERGQIKSNKLAIDDPAVLVSKLNPRIPRIWNINRLPEAMAVASTEFVVLAPIDVSTSALWAALSQRSVSVELASKVSGTSGSHQRVRPAEILALSIPDPRRLTPDRLGTIDALGEVTHAQRLERERLAVTRDELLPLLISGKIRVRDAARQVEDAL